VSVEFSGYASGHTTISYKYNRANKQKKSWFSRKWPIKAKTLSLVILTCWIYHKEGLLGKLWIGRLTSSDASGQAKSSSRTKLPDLSIADYPAPTCGRSGAHADGPAKLAGPCTHGQSHRIPHKAKKGMQGKSTCNAHGRLVKASPTFDQFLSKYASKKVVLCEWPTKKP
jgi:hypothetical protein